MCGLDAAGEGDQRGERGVGGGGGAARGLVAGGRQAHDRAGARAAAAVRAQQYARRLVLHASEDAVARGRHRNGLDRYEPHTHTHVLR